MECLSPMGDRHCGCRGTCRAAVRHGSPPGNPLSVVSPMGDRGSGCRDRSDRPRVSHSPPWQEPPAAALGAKGSPPGRPPRVLPPPCSDDPGVPQAPEVYQAESTTEPFPSGMGRSTAGRERSERPRCSSPSLPARQPRLSVTRCLVLRPRGVWGVTVTPQGTSPTEAAMLVSTPPRPVGPRSCHKRPWRPVAAREDPTPARGLLVPPDAACGFRWPLRGRMVRPERLSRHLAPTRIGKPTSRPRRPPRAVCRKPSCPGGSL